MPVPHLRKPNPRWQARQLGITRVRRRRSWLWLKVLLAAGAAGVVAVIGLGAWVSRDLPTPEGIARRIVPQSTKIYDRTGTHLLYDIHGEERRTKVELKDIPEQLKWATIATEDRDFYNHSGFRFTSMVRALLVNLVRGGKVQGGSTITQQFIKNAILTDEKSYIRKIKELVLAYEIERKFTKDEILQLYFNEIPYGSNAYGVEAAAETYFGTPVQKLDLAQSAVLAAMAQAPTYYSPWGSHRDELFGRQRYVLDAMVGLGHASKAEADAAKAEKLTFIPRRENITAPHFIFYVRELLAERYGERTVEEGGLKVTTTLDFDKQQLAEQAVAASKKKNDGYGAQNAGLASLDVPTGQILAMVGSRDFFDNEHDGQVNVTLRPFQPGSSFKPVVYSAAFNLGFTPQTTLFDVVTTFKAQPQDYTPHNYDGKEHGIVSLRQALAGSLNIPAVKLLYLTGVDKVLDLAQALGYTTLKDRSRFGLSLVLGGAEVKLLEHTNAYATLAREGVYLPTSAILRVEDNRGGTLEEWRQPQGTQVLPAQITRELTSILSDNQARSFIFGAQNYLTLPDRPVAAKTGTTNDYHDAWTLGFTPQLAAGVWVGNNNNQAMKQKADGSVVAAPIWQQYMRAALANAPVQPFTPPDPVVTGKPILDGAGSGEVVEMDTASGKRATALTPPSFRVTKVYRQYHTILTYVTPGNPLGPAPADPTSELQYQNWESAVRAWAEAQGLRDEYPPTEYDDLHTEASRPSVAITSPSANQTATGNPLAIAVSVSAPRGVRRVAYALDGRPIGESRLAPFGFDFPITDEWPNGYHTLTATAYDDIDNSASAGTMFSLLTTAVPSPYSVSFVAPTDGANIALGGQAYDVVAAVTHPELVKQLDLYARAPGGASQWVGVASSPGSLATIPWTPAGPGTYTLSLTITSRDGSSRAGPTITVTVTL